MHHSASACPCTLWLSHPRWRRDHSVSLTWFFLHSLFRGGRSAVLQEGLVCVRWLQCRLLEDESALFSRVPRHSWGSVHPASPPAVTCRSPTPSEGCAAGAHPSQEELAGCSLGGGVEALWEGHPSPPRRPRAGARCRGGASRGSARDAVLLRPRPRSGSRPRSRRGWGCSGKTMISDTATGHPVPTPLESARMRLFRPVAVQRDLGTGCCCCGAGPSQRAARAWLRPPEHLFNNPE